MSKSLTKIKAIEIIKTFSKEERSEFKKFLASPYFNNNSKIMKLYDLILIYENQISADDITEKDLFLKLNNTSNYSYSTMRNLMSSLLNLCEEFLIINASRNDDSYKFENDLKLLKQFSLRFLDKNYKLKFKKTESQLDYNKLGEKYFRYKFKLYANLHKFDHLRSNFMNNKNTFTKQSVLNLCIVISALSEDLSRIRYLQDFLNYTSELNPAANLFKDLDLNKFLDEIKSLDKFYYDHIRNEIKFIMLSLYPDNFENYYDLKKLVFRNFDSYSNPEKYYHSSRLIMYVTHHYDKGNQKLIYEITDIRKFQLKNIKYGKEGVDSLPMFIFINIIDCFLQTDDIKFIESFVLKHLENVESVNRANALNYALARIELKKNNFEKAISHLSEISLKSFVLKFQVKMLMIQAYYELGYYESGLAAIDSLKHFMKDNNDFKESVKNKYNGFIRITEKIFRIKMNPVNYSIFDLDKLVKDVSSPGNTTWYNLKIEELRFGYSKKKKFNLTA